MDKVIHKRSNHTKSHKKKTQFKIGTSNEHDFLVPCVTRREVIHRGYQVLLGFCNHWYHNVVALDYNIMEHNI
jgi:hypothetical protein